MRRGNVQCRETGGVRTERCGTEEGEFEKLPAIFRASALLACTYTQSRAVRVLSRVSLRLYLSFSFSLSLALQSIFISRRSDFFFPSCFSPPLVYVHPLSPPLCHILTLSFSLCTFLSLYLSRVSFLSSFNSSVKKVYIPLYLSISCSRPPSIFAYLFI